MESTGFTSVWAQLWRAAVLGILLAAGALFTFLEGVGGRPRGWLWAPLILAGGAVVAAGLLWWRRPRQRAALVLAGAAGAVVGLLVAGGSPPSDAALRAALDEVALPAGAELIEESAGGNVICFDSCPSVNRDYEVTGADREEMVAQMRASLQEAGYDLRSPSAPGDQPTFATQPDDSGVYLQGRVDRDPDNPDRLIVQLSAHPD